MFIPRFCRDARSFLIFIRIASYRRASHANLQIHVIWNVAVTFNLGYPCHAFRVGKFRCSMIVTLTVIVSDGFRYGHFC